MMIIKILFMIIMVFEFSANTAYTAHNMMEEKDSLLMILYHCIKFFLFIWIVANRSFF